MRRFANSILSYLLDGVAWLAVLLVRAWASQKALRKALTPDGPKTTPEHALFMVGQLVRWIRTGLLPHKESQTARSIGSVIHRWYATRRVVGELILALLTSRERARERLRVLGQLLWWIVTGDYPRSSGPA